MSVTLQTDQLSCSEILQSDKAQLGYLTTFDQGNGKVLLLGGKACWKEIIETLEDADEFVRGKLEAFDSAEINPHKFGLPTLEEYTDMIDKIPEYTDGYVVITEWKWPRHAVAPGEEAGLCLQQGAENFASCWSFKKNSNGWFEKKNESYLVDYSAFDIDTKLSDFQDIGEDMCPAFNGGWLCGSVMPMGNYDSVDCMRFMPKSEMASIQDPRFEPGTINVMTYMEGRDATDLAPVEGLSPALQSAARSFESFDIKINGAFTNVVASMGALTAAVFAFAF